MANPFIKFTAGVGSYFIFVGMIVAFATSELPSMGWRISNDTLMGPLWLMYTQEVAARNETPVIQDIYLRDTSINAANIVVSIWIIGQYTHTSSYILLYLPLSARLASLTCR